MLPPRTLVGGGNRQHSQAPSWVTSASASNCTPASLLCVRLLKKSLLIYLFMCLSPAQRYRICLPSRRHGFCPWVRDHPLEEEMATHSSVSCLENSMGRGAWQATVSVQFSRSVMSDSLRSHGLQHARPPCPSPIPGAYSNSRPSSW